MYIEGYETPGFTVLYLVPGTRYLVPYVCTHLEQSWDSYSQSRTTNRQIHATATSACTTTTSHEDESYTAIQISRSVHGNSSFHLGSAVCNIHTTLILLFMCLPTYQVPSRQCLLCIPVIQLNIFICIHIRLY